MEAIHILENFLRNVSGIKEKTDSKIVRLSSAQFGIVLLRVDNFYLPSLIACNCNPEKHLVKHNLENTELRNFDIFFEASRLCFVEYISKNIKTASFGAKY